MKFKNPEKWWNYVYLSTDKLLHLLSLILFIKPILSFYKLTGILKGPKLKRAERGFAYSETGVEAYFAFSWMVFTLALFFGTIGFYLVKLFRIDIQEEAVYFIVGVPLLSFCINWFLIRKDDKYLTYARKFKKEQENRRWLILSLTIHLVSVAVFLLSVFL